MTCENCSDAFQDGMEMGEKKYADLLSAAKAAVEFCDDILRDNGEVPTIFRITAEEGRAMLTAAIKKAGAE